MGKRAVGRSVAGVRAGDDGEAAIRFQHDGIDVRERPLAMLAYRGQDLVLGHARLLQRSMPHPAVEHEHGWRGLDDPGDEGRAHRTPGDHQLEKDQQRQCRQAKRQADALVHQYGRQCRTEGDRHHEVE
jgi:hypothetical protein